MSLRFLANPLTSTFYSRKFIFLPTQLKRWITSTGSFRILNRQRTAPRICVVSCITRILCISSAQTSSKCVDIWYFYPILSTDFFRILNRSRTILRIFTLYFGVLRVMCAFFHSQISSCSTCTVVYKDTRSLVTRNRYRCIACAVWNFLKSYEYRERAGKMCSRSENVYANYETHTARTALLNV